MPIQYSSILREAKAVRSYAGVFDVSHMGLVEIKGKKAADFLNLIVTANVAKMVFGRAKYTLICNEYGGIIDDTILYRFDEENFLLVPNAANTDEVLRWIYKWKSYWGMSVEINLLTDHNALIALQGPKSESILGKICRLNISELKVFHCRKSWIEKIPIIVCRTGYTGEDGFELVVPEKGARYVWEKFIELGAVPCGLGSRDVLRLEAGLLLHGSDMDSSVNPLEAGLDRFVAWDKEKFVGLEHLQSVRERGFKKRLVGLKLLERGVPRPGQEILCDGVQVGSVTSGTYSPILNMGIGLGYVSQAFSSPGTRVIINIRGRDVQSEVVKTPFYNRKV